MSESKWEKRFQRERAARKEAERLLEQKSLELWNLNNSLEDKVAQRTDDLEHALENLEKTSKAKDDFLSSMSHEIRTPLNAIIGFVDIMLRKDPDAEKRKKYLTTIQQSGKNLLRVINDILDFTKLQSGKMNIHLQNNNLKTILKDNCKMFQEQAQERGISFFIHFSEDFPEQLLVDEIRIVQIMNNFLSNALKFTNAQDSIDVSVSFNKEKSHLKILVKDTGIGIEDEKQESIFKPFEQEESGTTRKYGGTGLGLAISLSLIKIMNGRLIFESKKGVGSTFGFTLPLQEWR